MNDQTPTTIKETTLYAPTFNVNNQKEGIFSELFKAIN